MKAIEFSYKDSCLVPESELKKIGEQLKPAIKKIQQALMQGYDSPYASLNLSTDARMFDIVRAVIAQKKSLKPTMLIVIGIGGSNLGTMAVHEAVHGKFYNESNPEITGSPFSQNGAKIKVYWADTVDADYINAIAMLMDAELHKGNNILLNVVSKSGTTTETIANFIILLNILKKHRPDDYGRYVVATTDKDSALWQLAQQEHFVFLEIPKNVGGRYSVFSCVGLFPLGMLGVDIQDLREGARSAMPEYTDANIFDNPAALSAAILATYAHAGKNIHDTFLFSNQLESLGKWYRQLMGESIGKSDRQGSRIGITPTVSIGSTDLHSVGQLYLGGPKDKCTTFVTIKSCAIDMNISYMQDYDQLAENIQDKQLTTIMHAIIKGVQKAYQHESLPYMTFEFPESSVFYVGQFLQCKMLEIMYLGYLLEVNPFDQPNVELYKQETREILKI